MFDQVLAEAISEAEVITRLIGHDGGEIPQDPLLAQHLEAARRLAGDPGLITGLTIHMSESGKSTSWR